MRFIKQKELGRNKVVIFNFFIINMFIIAIKSNLRIKLENYILIILFLIIPSIILFLVI